MRSARSTPNSRTLLSREATVPAVPGHQSLNQYEGRKGIMKKILMAAVALTAMTATPAFAAPGTSQTYTFDGTVASISGAALVNFGALTDNSGAYTGSGTHQDATDTNAYCNQAATTAEIKHTNFVNANTATTGFTNLIPMSASLSTTQGASLSDATAASGTGTSTGTSGTIGAFTGLKVTATLGAIGTDKLVSGTYNGSITVTLTPTS